MYKKKSPNLFLYAKRFDDDEMATTGVNLTQKSSDRLIILKNVSVEAIYPSSVNTSSVIGIVRATPCYENEKKNNITAPTTTTTTTTYEREHFYKLYHLPSTMQRGFHILFNRVICHLKLDESTVEPLESSFSSTTCITNKEILKKICDGGDSLFPNFRLHVITAEIGDLLPDLNRHFCIDNYKGQIAQSWLTRDDHKILKCWSNIIADIFVHYIVDKIIWRAMLFSVLSTIKLDGDVYSTISKFSHLIDSALPDQILLLSDSIQVSDDDIDGIYRCRGAMLRDLDLLDDRQVRFNSPPPLSQNDNLRSDSEHVNRIKRKRDPVVDYDESPKPRDCVSAFRSFMEAREELDSETIRTGDGNDKDATASSVPPPLTQQKWRRFMCNYLSFTSSSILNGTLPKKNITSIFMNMFSSHKLSYNSLSVLLQNSLLYQMYGGGDDGNNKDERSGDYGDDARESARKLLLHIVENILSDRFVRVEFWSHFVSMDATRQSEIQFIPKCVRGYFSLFVDSDDTETTQFIWSPIIPTHRQICPVSWLATIQPDLVTVLWDTRIMVLCPILKILKKGCSASQRDLFETFIPELPSAVFTIMAQFATNCNIKMTEHSSSDISLKSFQMISDYMTYWIVLLTILYHYGKAVPYEHTNNHMAYIDGALFHYIIGIFTRNFNINNNKKHLFIKRDNPYHIIQSAMNMYASIFWTETSSWGTDMSSLYKETILRIVTNPQDSPMMNILNLIIQMDPRHKEPIREVVSTLAQCNYMVLHALDSSNFESRVQTEGWFFILDHFCKYSILHDLRFKFAKSILCTIQNKINCAHRTDILQSKTVSSLLIQILKTSSRVVSSHHLKPSTYDALQTFNICIQNSTVCLGAIKTLRQYPLHNEENCIIIKPTIVFKVNTCGISNPPPPPPTFKGDGESGENVTTAYSIFSHYTTPILRVHTSSLEGDGVTNVDEGDGISHYEFNGPTLTLCKSQVTQLQSVTDVSIKTILARYDAQSAWDTDRTLYIAPRHLITQWQTICSWWFDPKRYVSREAPTLHSNLAIHKIVSLSHAKGMQRAEDKENHYPCYEATTARFIQIHSNFQRANPNHGVLVIIPNVLNDMISILSESLQKTQSEQTAPSHVHRELEWVRQWKLFCSNRENGFLVVCTVETMKRHVEALSMRMNNSKLRTVPDTSGNRQYSDVNKLHYMLCPSEGEEPSRFDIWIPHIELMSLVELSTMTSLITKTHAIQTHLASIRYHVASSNYHRTEPPQRDDTCDYNNPLSIHHFIQQIIRLSNNNNDDDRDTITRMRAVQHHENYHLQNNDIDDNGGDAYSNLSDGIYSANNPLNNSVLAHFNDIANQTCHHNSQFSNPNKAIPKSDSSTNKRIVNTDGAHDFDDLDQDDDPASNHRESTMDIDLFSLYEPEKFSLASEASSSLSSISSCSIRTGGADMMDPFNSSFDSATIYTSLDSSSSVLSDHGTATYNNNNTIIQNNPLPDHDDNYKMENVTSTKNILDQLVSFLEKSHNSNTVYYTTGERLQEIQKDFYNVHVREDEPSKLLKTLMTMSDCKTDRLIRVIWEDDDDDVKDRSSSHAIKTSILQKSSKRSGGESVKHCRSHPFDAKYMLHVNITSELFLLSHHVLLNINPMGSLSNARDTVGGYGNGNSQAFYRLTEHMASLPTDTHPFLHTRYNNNDHVDDDDDDDNMGSVHLVMSFHQWKRKKEEGRVINMDDDEIDNNNNIEWVHPRKIWQMVQHIFYRQKKQQWNEEEKAVPPVNNNNRRRRRPIILHIVTDGNSDIYFKKFVEYWS